MNINIEKIKGGNSTLEIVYAYEFNRETVQFKLKDTTKTLICFVVKDSSKPSLQEYYFRKEKPSYLLWHNVFISGAAFEKRISAVQEGETFNYQKAEYFWRKLTSNEVAEIVQGKTFIEEI